MEGGKWREGGKGKEGNSIADTIGNQHLVPYSEVSLTQGLPVYLQ